MIGRLRGTLVETGEHDCLIDCAGVGYVASCGARPVLLTPLGLHMKDGLVAGCGQTLQGAGAAAGHIADPGAVDQAVVLAGLDQSPPQTPDHAASVRTRRRWAWVMATARASAASAFTSPAVGSRRRIMKAIWPLSA